MDSDRAMSRKNKRKRKHDQMKHGSSEVGGDVENVPRKNIQEANDPPSMNSLAFFPPGASLNNPLGLTSVAPREGSFEQGKGGNKCDEMRNLEKFEKLTIDQDKRPPSLKNRTHKPDMMREPYGEKTDGIKDQTPECSFGLIDQKSSSTMAAEKPNAHSDKAMDVGGSDNSKTFLPKSVHSKSSEYPTKDERNGGRNFPYQNEIRAQQPAQPTLAIRPSTFQPLPKENDLISSVSLFNGVTPKTRVATTICKTASLCLDMPSYPEMGISTRNPAESSRERRGRRGRETASAEPQQKPAQGLLYWIRSIVDF